MISCNGKVGRDLTGTTNHILERGIITRDNDVRTREGMMQMVVYLKEEGGVMEREGVTIQGIIIEGGEYCQGADHHSP